MKRVVWLSRHDMSLEQQVDLACTLGNEISVYPENVTWEATADAASDLRANVKTLDGLFDRYGSYAELAGVFPPVALEAMRSIGIHGYTPVSRQSAELRADGSRQIAFQHVRWTKV